MNMSRMEYFENLYVVSMNYTRCIRNFENTSNLLWVVTLLFF